MRDRLDEFGDAEVAVIHFDQTDRLGQYRSHFEIPDRITLVADPERRTYEALGIGRGPWWRVYRPGVLVGYARRLLSGQRYEGLGSDGDTLQLGGDLVVGPDGKVRYLFEPADPDARPPVDDLVAALDRGTHER